MIPPDRSRASSRLHGEAIPTTAQDAVSAVDVESRALQRRGLDASVAAEEGGAHLGDELSLGVGVRGITLLPACTTSDTVTMILGKGGAGPAEFARSNFRFPNLLTLSGIRTAALACAGVRLAGLPGRVSGPVRPSASCPQAFRTAASGLTKSPAMEHARVQSWDARATGPAGLAGATPSVISVRHSRQVARDSLTAQGRLWMSRR